MDSSNFELQQLTADQRTLLANTLTQYKTILDKEGTPSVPRYVVPDEANLAETTSEPVEKSSTKDNNGKG